MNEQYTITEAKNRLPAIVHAVENGPSVRLTRHGRPVAVLISVKEYESLSRKKSGFWDALTMLRNKAVDNQITDHDFEGLRDDAPGRSVEPF